MEVLLWTLSPNGAATGSSKDAPTITQHRRSPNKKRPAPAPAAAESGSEADANDGKTTSNKNDRSPVAKKKKTGSTKAKDKKFDPYVTEINNNDVLCYRGREANENEGNKAFLALVNSRKKEYRATPKRRPMKSAIAQSIVDHVRLELVPPGRFLKRVDGNELVNAGYRRQDRVWKRVDEAKALEKTKQALREKYVPIAFGGGRPGSKAKESAQAEATAKAVEGDSDQGKD